MGLFKGMKDMKDMLHAAPGLLDQANQLSANGQAMQQQAAQQAAGAAAAASYATAPAAPVPAELLEPIAGVDLATFAQVSAGLAAYAYDQTQAVVLAGQRGIDAASWDAAVDGWNGRIAANPAVARQFNALYTGRA